MTEVACARMDADNNDSDNDSYYYESDCSDEPAEIKPVDNEPSAEDEEKEIHSIMIREYADLFRSDTIISRRIYNEIRIWKKNGHLYPGILLYPESEDSITSWYAILTNFSDAKLKEQLSILEKEKGIMGLTLRIFFGEQYPYEPPFLYVESPIIKSQGSKFGVFNGVPCFDFLAPTKWNSATILPDLILQIKSFLDGGVSIEMENDGIITYELAQQGKARILSAHQREWTKPIQSIKCVGTKPT